ncbi:dTDP-4-dehydrorhamnose reductase [Pseudorhodobacter sp. E13]|uniref:dTDP-4-dehydrorhamnose reductase n=1 Tax=Pseudorhodobacter sp. E13 TaxID=2487931 RepID=UPI000F8DDBC2|nr:dTDP-4-dehydrorhamnose reductase [Pseudorhodobacter sp. E13]RUS64830.1 dTDP-4-dehydrorhamnose reductase [Pseudorhodobacter sp. E13]
MTCLVFGKTGQLASALQRQSAVTALGRETADLSDPAACAAAIYAARPSVVINAAAWTAVDAAESHEAQAHVINAEAPGAMAKACAALKIPFLHVSTDYVFDGTGSEPWRENDPVAPLGAYGRTKLAGENAVRAAGGAHVILRTSWVFSAFGSNFVKTMLRLSETRNQLSIVNDQIGGPTPAADIATTLLHMAEAMQAGHAGGTYHYGGAPVVSWADFAREIFAQAGRAVTIEGIPSKAYPTPAQRPLNSRLSGAALQTDFGIAPADWQAGLALVLRDLGCVN